ncbi:MAG: alpha-ketoglutarate-dependent dioxygenase AlkB [Scytolyngbya sp. HA4215-MV1]|jgi:alkylated DNA repair dioxygenase AlkB|nr:alpha-ketoglutarate-dependent dioxygenase AlkB [Scytolyngbya sp. HA4215-MV1]
MPQQLSLWNKNLAVGSKTFPITISGEKLDLPNAEIMFYSQGIPQSDADCCFQQLATEIIWRQDSITLYQKSIALPRLTAWYGDPGKTYTYSGIEMLPTPWTPTLLAIKSQVEALAGVQFNSVLLNLYRHGRDSVAWHSDDEPELGENPTIASVSLGGTRRFCLKHRQQRHLRHHLELTHGSILLMLGCTQHYWQHQIPKTQKLVPPRINLTFRTILDFEAPFLPRRWQSQDNSLSEKPRFESFPVGSAK